MARKRLYPLPEVIAKGPWDIRHLPHGGHSGRSSRVFAAPLDDTAFARAVRAHELAHVRFSPSRPNAEHHRVRPDTLNAVEDARVNELARRAGLGDVLLDLDDPTQEDPDPRFHLRAATLLLVARHTSRAVPRLQEAYGRAGDLGLIAQNLARRAVRVFEPPRRAPSFRATIAVARMLDRLLDLSEPLDAPPDGLEALLTAATAVPGLPRAGTTKPGERPAPPRWGELRAVEEPARSVPCRPAGLVPAYRATDEGTWLRWPHRLPVDGKVFARRVRQEGGTVLIDASSSMKLKPPDVLGIVGAAAGAQVACYEGVSEGWGVIRVLVRGGRRVPDSLVKGPTGCGANVIDGPALRWLARQPAPRIWVSDGHVTGVGDRGAPRLAEEALRICRAAGIVRVANADGARDALRRRRPSTR